jgi:hypothetical protein
VSQGSSRQSRIRRLHEHRCARIDGHSRDQCLSRSLHLEMVLDRNEASCVGNVELTSNNDDFALDASAADK